MFGGSGPTPTVLLVFLRRPESEAVRWASSFRRGQRGSRPARRASLKAAVILDPLESDCRVEDETRVGGLPTQNRGVGPHRPRRVPPFTGPVVGFLRGGLRTRLRPPLQKNASNIPPGRKSAPAPASLPRRKNRAGSTHPTRRSGSAVRGEMAFLPPYPRPRSLYKVDRFVDTSVCAGSLPAKSAAFGSLCLAAKPARRNPYWLSFSSHRSRIFLAPFRLCLPETSHSMLQCVRKVLQSLFLRTKKGQLRRPKTLTWSPALPLFGGR